jgi:rhodanese-related sulfurtransferase
MFPILTVICGALLATALVLYLRRRRAQRRLDEHTITPEALHGLLGSQAMPLVFDVRLPLDLLADSEIIPGAMRVAPKEVLKNPELIPREQDAVIYCTCPSDETSRAVLERALEAQFVRVKLLKGGLAGWKAAGYPVEPYQSSFHLDTA